MPAFIDLTGQRFHRLVVLSRAERSNHGHIHWRALCDCGQETVVPGGSLRTGNTKSCGCWKSRPSEHLQDLSGKRFGRILVISQAEHSRNGKHQWNTVCDCGRHKVIIGESLYSGKSKSCGCLNSEINSKRCLRDLSGQRFGRLLIIERVENGDNGRVRWNAVCDCGNNKVVVAAQLLAGHTRSCGCYFREVAASNTSNNLPHDTPDMLYLLKMVDKDTQETFLKVGRTIKGIKKRYYPQEYKAFSITTIHTREDQHAIISALEMEIKDGLNTGLFTRHRPQTAFRGHMECLTTDDLLNVCEFIDTYLRPYDPLVDQYPELYTQN